MVNSMRLALDVKFLFLAHPYELVSVLTVSALEPFHLYLAVRSLVDDPPFSMTPSHSGRPGDI